MTVAYSAKGDSFTADKPRLWAEQPVIASATYSTFDLAPDGKYIAAALQDSGASRKPPTHLTFIFNFTAELQRRTSAVGQ